MLYPPIAPRQNGFLGVGDGHRLYWEVSGRADGVPVVALHGGPGAGCTGITRRWFDPRVFRIITFDQRGSGRSTPQGAIADNTTHHLVRDLEVLRTALQVDRWILFGRSWGCALALAYAQRHPRRVRAMIVSAVFTARQQELDWLYGGGSAHLAPEAWAPFAGEYRSAAALTRDYVARLTCHNPSVQTAAARAWCAWEQALADQHHPCPAREDHVSLSRARISAHYFVNNAFLEEGELLANATHLCHIPGLIVQGADDAVTPPAAARDLHDAWPGSELHIVADAGHRSTEPAMMRALIAATDALRIKARHRGSAAMVLSGG
jgi:proline iminopeptidase